MDNITEKEIIKTLSQRIDKLENNKSGKDIWDIIGIVSSFLIPLSIFIAGYFFSKAEREAQHSNEIKEVQLAEIKSKIDQALLVSTFLEALVDTNSYKRQLAVKSILLALPDKGPELVQIVSINDPDEAVKQFAKTSLKENKQQIEKLILIRNIFSDDTDTRKRSTQMIISYWSQDPTLIPDLLSIAKTKLDDKYENKSGIINTLYILKSLDANMLRKYYQEVNVGLEVIESLPGRKQSKAMAKEIREKMNSI